MMSKPGFTVEDRAKHTNSRAIFANFEFSNVWIFAVLGKIDTFCTGKSAENFKNL